MAHQYFEDNTGLEHEYRQIKVTVHDHVYRFKTDTGVFSRYGLDYGSRTLTEAVLNQGELKGRVLDLGCGYGPIGIILAKENPACELTMVDVSERALELARENAQANGVDNVTIYLSDAYDQVEGRFRTIVTNPPVRAGKAVVHSFIEGAPDYLDSGGRLYVVLRKKQGAPSARKKMAEVFGKVDRIKLDKGYWVLMSTFEE